MPFTTIYKRGEIVLVSFPFTDLSSIKQRPALVVSPDSLNSTREDLLIIAITSQIPPTLEPDEFMIPASDLVFCGLPKPSIVRVSKLASLHKTLIIKRIGIMPAPSMEHIRGILRGLF
jgi:mRNA interferase MazF